MSVYPGYQGIWTDRGPHNKYNMSSEDKIKTNQHCNGTWRTRWQEDKQEYEILLSISNREIVLQRNYDHQKEVEKFNASLHWFGDYLCLVGSMNKYYIRSADEQFLIFGEQKPHHIDQTSWERTFERLDMSKI